MASHYADEFQSSVNVNFPLSSWLSDDAHVDHLMQWVTFWRRNLHRFATTYLGLSLYPYQLIMLYLMGISKTFVCIAARSAAKSYLIAIYACCMAILYPGSKIVIASGTKGQAKLIVSEKIRNELMSQSHMLNIEIASVKDNQNDVIVYFNNKSSIKVVPASENARGNRSTILIHEEFRMIPKNIADSILTPFQIVRQTPFAKRPEYADVQELVENPISIYISSSWMKSHWMWNLISKTGTSMLEGKNDTLIAFDYSIALRHNIKTREAMITAKASADPLSWAIEYENLMPTENAHAYFTYKMLSQCQTLKNVFYPRRDNATKYKCNISKVPDEIRVISCDIAMMEGSANDNSVFTCMRLLPEKMVNDGANSFGYRIQVPHIEALNGVDTLRQVIRMKQLEEDFEADYIVLDARSFGISIYDTGARVIYDDERGKEYAPWRCMNNQELANHVNTINAKENLYAITANIRLNNDMAVVTREMITSSKIELPVSVIEAEDVLMNFKEYATTSDEYTTLYYRSPYLEGALLIDEMVNLEYEKAEQTGIIRLSEASSKRKDRYVSFAMGCYFASQLARDVFGQAQIDFETFELPITNMDSFFDMR